MNEVHSSEAARHIYHFNTGQPISWLFGQANTQGEGEYGSWRLKGLGWMGIDEIGIEMGINEGIHRTSPQKEVGSI